jgi:signal transduction histidine kinase
MTCSIVGLILGVYYSTALGLFFAILPIALGILAYLTDSNIMPRPSYDPVMIKINFIANIVIGILSNIVIVYFLISRNKESEASLRENEQHSKKIAEDLSLKNIQLAKTNEELDRFVYSASHDMRAPLSSLMGLINISEKTADVTEIKTYLHLMKGRIHTMDGFIREITDYARNSRLGLMLEKVNLQDIIKKVADDLSYIDADRKVWVEILPGCNRMVQTDVNRLSVVINNLLSNAYRYHRCNQASPFIEFNATETDEAIILTVRDNGQGIPAEHVPKIFDMFYRASDISEGSGLGLYIVKETLDKLGGTISVQSVLGEGSVFTITLPR